MASYNLDDKYESNPCEEAQLQSTMKNPRYILCTYPVHPDYRPPLQQTPLSRSTFQSLIPNEPHAIIFSNCTEDSKTTSATMEYPQDPPTSMLVEDWHIANGTMIQATELISRF